MAECTAPVTGRHRDDESLRNCPRCGLGLRTLEREVDRLNGTARPQPQSKWPLEQNRKRRGHNFYPPASVKVPSLAETEGVSAADKEIVAHYFIGGSDWWVAEIDRNTGEAFGYAVLNRDTEMSEWGYVSLPELESMKVGPLGFVVERDAYWTPCKARDIAGIPERSKTLPD